MRLAVPRVLASALVLSATAAGLAGVAHAHHGWSNYNSDAATTLEGPVTEMNYANPHGTLKMEVDGKVWEVILAPPSRMRSRGLADGHIQVGTAVTVEGYPHRSIETELRAERITVDGKTVELR